jgi:hypothetical protein
MCQMVVQAVTEGDDQVLSDARRCDLGMHKCCAECLMMEEQRHHETSMLGHPMTSHIIDSNEQHPFRSLSCKVTSIYWYKGTWTTDCSLVLMIS